LGIGLILLILGHEPIKSAWWPHHKLPLVLLLICLPSTNLQPAWNKCAQNLNTGGTEGAGTRGVGSVDLAAGGGELAKLTGPVDLADWA
jgi:hypothetical protein